MSITNPGISLIVSTYNWPRALELCLESISRQSVFPNEVIIADDGSGNETKTLVPKLQQTFPVPLIHVWQEDEGFQLSKIRNKAIARAENEYIIQIDGDLILQKNFIEDHIAFIKPRSFVSGTRVQMSNTLSEQLLNGEQGEIKLMSRELTNHTNAMRVPLLRSFFANRYKRNDPTYVRGCNMAFWRSDLIAVNGYNESITGWGREDSELAIRLINSGVNKRILKFGAVAFHIYHYEAKRANLPANDAILTKSIDNRVKRCEHGISSYL